jgi:hypothetical protein
VIQAMRNVRPRQSLTIVQVFDGVPIENGDDGAGEVGGDDTGDNQEDKEERPWKRAQRRKAPYALAVSGAASCFCLRDRCPISAHRPKGPRDYSIVIDPAILVARPIVAVFVRTV